MPEALESLYEHHTYIKVLEKRYCAFCILKLTKSLKREDLRKKDLSISIF